MIFDSRSNFDSPNDDSGSRFIYIWPLVDDFRSRISSFFFWYNLRSRFNPWLVTRGQELILSERWFARLWGLNNWFWRFFLMCLWRFVHGEVFPWRFFLMFSFLEVLIVKNFYLGGNFPWSFFFFFFIVKICSIAHLRGLKIVLVCSYWGLKSLCWLFDSGSLA